MLKIIVVDDLELIRDEIKRELEIQDNFEVILAEDGLKGLEVIKKNQDCSIIITDLNMPNMDGFEMLEALNKENLCTNIPKIILTTEDFLGGENSDKLFDKGKELGVEAWIPKGSSSNPKNDRSLIISGVIKRVLKKRA